MKPAFGVRLRMQSCNSKRSPGGRSITSRVPVDDGAHRLRELPNRPATAASRPAASALTAAVPTHFVSPASPSCVAQRSAHIKRYVGVRIFGNFSSAILFVELLVVCWATPSMTVCDKKLSMVFLTNDCEEMIPAQFDRVIAARRPLAPARGPLRSLCCRSAIPTSAPGRLFREPNS